MVGVNSLSLRTNVIWNDHLHNHDTAFISRCWSEDRGLSLHVITAEVSFSQKPSVVMFTFNNWKCITSKLYTDTADRQPEVGTDLFASHGLEHLLQLDTQLLDVVKEDAGLWKHKGNIETMFCKIQGQINPIRKNIKYIFIMLKLQIKSLCWQKSRTCK